ncbi:hypothetical protein JGU71_09665 [Antrihabitans sp. YC3-6]|jgi:hypothetical protein|uniref:Uncharacterized protein n=1 Tax=Antrihabitans stalagmiti TaxID=2799499 RepID=A0A934U3S7_9NOCA|nr:hypothetical protein [Antrihabitans stalagmiti]MBJ8339153.1 hypothetical protein [Antrihabitans stalagmiti]
MRFPIAATGFACTAAAATLVLSAGTASAADGNTQTTIYTLANPGICAGIIDAGVGHYPDSAALGLTGMLYGVGPCSVELTFHFKRQGDGVTADYTRKLNGPGAVGTSKDIVQPGIGIWDVTVTSNGASFGAQPMKIDIPKYEG